MLCRCGLAEDVQVVTQERPVAADDRERFPHTVPFLHMRQKCPAMLVGQHERIDTREIVIGDGVEPIAGVLDHLHLDGLGTLVGHRINVLGKSLDDGMRPGRLGICFACELVVLIFRQPIAMDGIEVGLEVIIDIHGMDGRCGH